MKKGGLVNDVQRRNQELDSQKYKEFGSDASAELTT